MEQCYQMDTSALPKIKWVKNSRVKRNRKIQPWNVIEKESDAQDSDVVVTMKNSSKKYPTVNIGFPSKTETSSRKERTRNGQWITKSWRIKNSLTVSINTEDDFIDFNRTRYSKNELKRIMEVIDYVSEII